MRKRKCNRTLKKRAVVTGLFLGMLCTLFGCVRPAVQPTGTPEPVTQSPEGPTGQVFQEPTPETGDPIGKPTPSLPTGEPTVSPTPVTGGAVSVTPEVTHKPTSIPSLPTGEPTVSPTPVTGGGISVTPMVTPEPTPEAVLTPEPTPEAVLTPEPTPEAVLTPTPTPEVVLTPEPTPEVTLPPEVPVEPAITPEPTQGPQTDYEMLLQNGWQRTEDFFNNKEIYFSGMFKQTELLTAPGRYEYRYTAPEDRTVVFSVIGEELPVQSFLDELTQKGTTCVITEEAENDYSYQYTEKGQTVSGRVYACTVDEKEYRMRIEIGYPASTGTQTEQYEFYLK